MQRPRDRMAFISEAAVCVATEEEGEVSWSTSITAIDKVLVSLTDLCVAITLRDPRNHTPVSTPVSSSTPAEKNAEAPQSNDPAAAEEEQEVAEGKESKVKDGSSHNSSASTSTTSAPPPTSPIKVFTKIPIDIALLLPSEQEVVRFLRVLSTLVSYAQGRTMPIQQCTDIASMVPLLTLRPDGLRVKPDKCLLSSPSSRPVWHASSSAPISGIRSQPNGAPAAATTATATTANRAAAAPGDHATPGHFHTPQPLSATFTVRPVVPRRLPHRGDTSIISSSQHPSHSPFAAVPPPPPSSSGPARRSHNTTALSSQSSAPYYYHHHNGSRDKYEPLSRESSHLVQQSLTSNSSSSSYYCHASEKHKKKRRGGHPLETQQADRGTLADSPSFSFQQPNDVAAHVKIETMREALRQADEDEVVSWSSSSSLSIVSM